jgi:hydroxymethylglutaryl-CoA lyase
MRDLQVVEVSPRDGLQNEPAVLTVDQRVELIARAVSAGCTRVEAASFVDPRRVPQMAHAEDVLAGIDRSRAVSYSGLALNAKGVERLIRAGCDELTFVVVATETFSHKNQGRSIGDTLIEWSTGATLARAHGLRISAVIAAAFGCPFEGPVPESVVLDLADRVAEQEPDELALADTIGVGVPAQVRDLIAGLRKRHSSVTVRCHFHNTRNTGYANALAAAEAGATVLDASIGGIGGCPFAPAATGNVATEDLAYLLRRSGFETGLDIDLLCGTAEWLSTVLGHESPGLLHRAGDFPASIATPADGK